MFLISSRAEVNEALARGALAALDVDRSDRVLVVVDTSDEQGQRLVRSLGFAPQPFFAQLRELARSGDADDKKYAPKALSFTEVGAFGAFDSFIDPFVTVMSLEVLAKDAHVLATRALEARGAEQVVVVTFTAGTVGAHTLTVWPVGRGEA
jgi:hypothetical protein